jgi:phosphoribosylanthranilate isomerase
LPIKAKEILEWTSGSHAVGEFGEQSAQEIEEISDLLGVDDILLDNQLLPDELSTFSKPIIKVIGLNQMTPEMVAKELEAYEPYCDGFQINAEGQSPEALLWIKPYLQKHKVILNVGNHAEIILQLHKTLEPFAFHLQAGNEEEVGMRDFDDLNDLLDAIGAREA